MDNESLHLQKRIKLSISKQIPIYKASTRQAMLALIWTFVSGHLMTVKPIFTSLSTLLLHKLLSEISGVLAATCSLCSPAGC